MVLQHVGLPQTVLKIPVPNIQMSKKLMKHVDILFTHIFLGIKPDLIFCEEKALGFICAAQNRQVSPVIFIFCPFSSFHHSNKSTRTNTHSHNL